jgi:hypothetical protein
VNCSRRWQLTGDVLDDADRGVVEVAAVDTLPTA